MALTIEDGTIVTDADSYGTAAALLAYATARGVTLVANTDVLMIKAMTYIENLNLKGSKLTKDQSLQYPRLGVVIDDFYINTDEIPQELIDLQFEVAIAIDEGDDPLNTLERDVKKEKVGDIEVEYQEGALPYDLNRRVGALESKLVNGGGLSVGAVRG